MSKSIINEAFKRLCIFKDIPDSIKNYLVKDFFIGVVEKYIDKNILDINRVVDIRLVSCDKRKEDKNTVYVFKLSVVKRFDDNFKKDFLVKFYTDKTNKISKIVIF